MFCYCDMHLAEKGRTFDHRVVIPKCQGKILAARKFAGCSPSVCNIVGFSALAMLGMK